MNTEPDFTTFTVDQLDAFCFEHRAAFDDETIERGELVRLVASGVAVIESRWYGFAVLHVDQNMPHLSLLYVNPANRGRRRGQRLVRELIRQYSREWHMTLNCCGARRRAFFGRLGFRVEHRVGELREMTSAPAMN